MSNYHFITNWSLKGRPEEIYRILEDVERLCEWWPSVYLKVTVTKPGAAGGVGKEVELLTKGWLPYLLKWKFKVIESHFPTGFSIEAMGDFVGKGIWTIGEVNEKGYCNVKYDWNIRAEKKLIRYLSWLLRPIFSANHHWAMRKGEVSLALELRRRRMERNVPEPPKAIFVGVRE